MNTTIRSTITRLAVAVAAATVGVVTLVAGPPANAAFVSTSEAVVPGATTVVVDLTAEDVRGLSSSDFLVQSDTALQLCSHQVLPNGGALPLDTKNGCQSQLMYCANLPLAANQLPTAYLVSNGTMGCGTYTVASWDELSDDVTAAVQQRSATITTSAEAVNAWWVQLVTALTLQPSTP
jgi:hypothetical protein